MDRASRGPLPESKQDFWETADDRHVDASFTGRRRLVDSSSGYPLEISYRRGRLHGPWRSFSKDGQQTCEANYRSGVLHGRYRVWSSVGHLLRDCYYRRGKLHGSARRWNQQGELIEDHRFALGVPLRRGLSPVPSWIDARGLRRRWPLLLLTLAAFTLLGWLAPYLLVCLGVLYVVILIHELGHGLAAKITGVWLSDFVVGVGPRLLDAFWGSTRMTWRAFPVFGYVVPRQLTQREHDWLTANRKRLVAASRRVSADEQAIAGEGVEVSEPVHFSGDRRQADYHHVSLFSAVIFFLGGVLLQLLLAALLLPLGQYLAESNVKEQVEVPIETSQGIQRLKTKTEAETEIALELRERQSKLDALTRQERQLRPQLQNDKQAVAEWVNVQRARSKLADQISMQHDELIRMMFARRRIESAGGVFERVGRLFVHGSPGEAVEAFAWINIYVAIFNLVPIPGFDGFHVLRLLFGRSLRRSLPTWLQTILVVIALLVGGGLLLQFLQQLGGELYRSVVR